MWPLFLPGAIGQLISVISSLLIVLVFLGMGGTIYYQNKKIDSLQKTIALTKDTIKMEQDKTEFAKTNTNAIKLFYDRPRPSPLKDGKLILDELFKNTPK
jgi:hypothetical protein